MNVLAIIPARSGSKSIPNKNIKEYCGKPLIAWTIEQAKKSRLITDIIVSTDSEEYKKVAETYGVTVPFLRPKELSDDNSTDYEFMKHTIDWLTENKCKIPDLIVHLRPTYPNRSVIDIDKAIRLFQTNLDYTGGVYTSLRSVVESDFPAYKMYTLDKNQLKPLFDRVNGIEEPYNNARQLLPKCYWHNGCIDITTPMCLEKFRSVSGDKILVYKMRKNETNDIDTIEEWDQSEKMHIIDSDLNGFM
jgi:CMP-N-acetylneuraminic acid synthetase